MSVISKNHQCPYRQIPHENLAYVVYHNGYWCFSCHKGNIKNDEYYSFKNNNVITVSEDLKIPDNYSSVKDFSLELKSWLYKYYVFDDTINEHNIRYCPYSYFQSNSGQVFEGESLLFPIICNMEIVAFQQRFFPSKVFFSKNTKKHILEKGHHKTNKVVLVEDYISAIRVGQIENCIGLLGVGLTNETLSYIVNTYKDIFIWLDGDEPGQKNANRIAHTLKFEVEKNMRWKAFEVFKSRVVKNIVTELDPKCYSNEEIRGILNEQHEI